MPAPSAGYAVAVTTFSGDDDPGRPAIGLHALGIGNGSRPQVMAAVATAAEAAGFARLWCGEHVVMIDSPASRYPYSDDGEIAVPAAADWLDPLLALSFLAGLTSRIRLATGILLLPEHNPVVVAKQAATLDLISAGRFDLGVGIGWSAEEFAALGVPFARRGERTDEYVAAMRRLWSADAATFHGKFVNFDAIRVNPKPVSGRRLPVIFGGTGNAALARVAASGDGWYGFSLPIAAVAERVGMLAGLCARHGRKLADLSVAVSLRDGRPALLPELAAAGVTELVLTGEPPADPAAAARWVRELAAQWSVTAR
jgi:probable F420-dependent oxidoreductase